jgi:hypothetical protein
MEAVSILQMVLTLVTLFWLVASWLRLRRYAHSLQLVDYKQISYGRWYWQDRAEPLYLGVGMSCLVLLLTAVLYILLSDLLFYFFMWDFLLAITFLPSATLIVLTLGSAVLSIVALVLAPRGREVRPPLAFTSRAVRLLITGGVLETLPMFLTLWGVGLLFRPTGLTASPANFSRTNLSVWILSCVFSGPMIYLLTPLALAVANLLNWPIDWARHGK